jgi:chloramphenicol O-acetyltransferase type A
MVHPLPLNPLDSVPRVAWGRFEERGNRLFMPLNVQAHHALIDGIHIAKFITRVEELIRIADSIL